MESRRALNPVLTAVLVGAAGFFCYSWGHQSGESEAREGLERQISEMRLALAADDASEDLYTSGDSDFEDEDVDSADFSYSSENDQTAAATPSDVAGE